MSSNIIIENRLKKYNIQSKQDKIIPPKEILQEIAVDHKIILEPYTEIPAQEKWLFKNHEALKKVKRGLEDSAAGRLRDKGSR